jgi:sterol-4alpha-carboxylate 3-dehydrogenase (decarboxylating)
MHGIYQVLESKRTHYQIGDNTNLFDFTYVENVAAAHLLAADKLCAPPSAFPTKEEVTFQPLKPLNLTSGERPVPSSRRRPIGPAVVEPPNAKELVEAFKAPDAILPEEHPVVRSRFDPFSPMALEAEPDSTHFRVDGEAFFITNGEPLYFWDFTRAVWHALDDPFTALPPPTVPGERSSQTNKYTVMSRGVGLALATLAESAAWVVGKEPAFTRFRVTHACCTKWHNIEKARRVLGYEPTVGVEEGIKRMVEVGCFCEYFQVIADVHVAIYSGGKPNMRRRRSSFVCLILLEYRSVDSCYLRAVFAARLHAV